MSHETRCFVFFLTSRAPGHSARMGAFVRQVCDFLAGQQQLRRLDAKDGDAMALERWTFFEGFGRGEGEFN